MGVIIFDFDGTMADSFDYVVGFLEQHVRYGKRLTADEKQALRGMTMPQMATHLGCPKWRFPWLFLVGRRVMAQAMYTVPMFKGIAKLLEELHNDGHKLAIVSSNNNRNIRKFLKQHHLSEYFADIYGDAGFFGKERAIRRLLARNRWQAKDAVYIGDETRDIMAAHALEVKVVAVSWGFDDHERLAGHHPTAIAQTIPELAKILKHF